MIKHIVMWKLRNKADAEIIKDNLEALPSKIPGLLKLEVGINFSNNEFAADIVLYSELESREALAIYQAHPEHQAVVPLVKTATVSRLVVDYDA
ncbi:MAG: Dabb family protein [Mariprofundaceae bacterium]|nr:Dabb family protein [Mariprofundaceae bacterium]